MWVFFTTIFLYILWFKLTWLMLLKSVIAKLRVIVQHWCLKDWRVYTMIVLGLLMELRKRVVWIDMSCWIAGEVEIRLDMVPTQTIKIDCWIFLILMLSDAIIGGKWLRGMIAYSSNRWFKHLEESSTAWQLRTELIWLLSILGFTSNSNCWGWPCELDGCGMSWRGCWRVRGRVGEVILNELLIEAMIFSEELLMLMSRLRVMSHIILL